MITGHKPYLAFIYNPLIHYKNRQWITGNSFPTVIMALLYVILTIMHDRAFKFYSVNTVLTRARVNEAFLYLNNIKYSFFLTIQYVQLCPV